MNVNPKIAAIISADVTQLVKGVRQANTTLMSLNGAAKTVSNTLAAFGIGFGAYQLVSGFKQVVGVMSEFEQTMSTLKAITQTTGDEFNGLRNDALRLAGTTKFASNEIGQLQVIFGRLGFSTQEIRNATEATLMLAQATGEDLATAADVAGSTIRAFQLDASETGRVADVMASALNKSALELSDFKESMKYVAPIAHAAGASVEEAAAMLSVLANSGIRGSIAGTSLRKIFTDMTKDGRPLQERLKELSDKGITLADSFDEVGRTAQTALLILSKNLTQVNELTTAYRNSNGELKKMSDIMMDNLIGDTDKLKASWQKLIITLSSSSVLRATVQTLTDLSNWLAQSPDLQRADAEAKAYIDVTNAIKKYSESVQASDLANAEAVRMADLVGNSFQRVQDKLSKLKKESERYEIGFAVPEKLKDDISSLEKESERLRIEWEALNKVGTQAISDFLNQIQRDALRATTELKPLVDGITATGRALGILVNGVGDTKKSPIANFGRFIPEFDNIAEKAKYMQFTVLESFNTMGQQAIVSTEAMNDALKGLAAGGLADLAEGFGRAIASGGDFASSFGNNALRVVVGFAKRFGEILIGMGVAALAAWNIIKSPAGAVAAIAAGAALVAIAGATQARMQAAHSSSFGGGGGGRGFDNSSFRSQQQTVLLGGEFKIDGRDLVLAVNKNSNLDNGRKLNG